MTLKDLKEQVAIEGELAQQTIELLDDLLGRIKGREPDSHELAAFGAYLHNLYTGIENVLMRFLRLHEAAKPDTANWHEGILRMFGETPAERLPVLLPSELMVRLTEYRGFRHVFVKRYAMHLAWPKLKPLVEGAAGVVGMFQSQAAKVIAEYENEPRA